MWNGLRLALSFLTTLTVLSATYEYDMRHWRTAIFYFPVIGGLVGGLAWLIDCMMLLVSNLILQLGDSLDEVGAETAVTAELNALLAAVATQNCH